LFQHNEPFCLVLRPFDLEIPAAPASHRGSFYIPKFKARMEQPDGQAATNNVGRA